jgi:hypothetical protein
MNQTSLDSQSGNTQDGHLARIVRLETQMDNVTTVLVNLQRTQEQHYQYTLTRFDDLRDRVDKVHLHTLERLERLQDRMDRNTRWLVGLMLANITAVAGLYARMLFA